MHLARGHQAIEGPETRTPGCVGGAQLRIPYRTRDGEAGFGAGGELHLKGGGGMLEEHLAGLGELKVQDFFQVGGAKRMVNNGFLNAAQKLREGSGA